MRKLFFITSVSVICFFTSCNNSATVASATTGNSETQKNLEASHAIDDAFKTGDASKLDNYIASDFLDHTDHGDLKGIDSLKVSVKMIKDNFSNINMDIIKEMADSNYVFTWVHFTGTSNGKFGPAGPFDMHAIEIGRYKDGKCVEHWEYDDPTEMMKLMGQMQSTPDKNMNKADSAKMKSK